MGLEIGWRSCRRCQGLISLRVPPGTCLDGGMHDFMYGAEYRAVRDEFPGDVQRAWGPCVRCARLVCRFMEPGVCHDGNVHEFAEFGSEYGVNFGPDVGENEPGWRWCNRCQCLNDAKNPSQRCFAGDSHDFTGSVEYSVSVIRSGLQTEWMWCNRCQGVVHGWGEGVCHEREPHQFDGVTVYALAYGVVPEGSQPGWRLCTKCAGLAAGGDIGACYAGDAHDFSSALTYSIVVDVVPRGAQPGWRWCSKCQMMSFSQFSLGPCPAGGSHDPSTSAAYSLFPESLFDGQPGWRRCGTCQAMTFTQLTLGVCRDRAPHDVSASGWYTVPYVVVPDGSESRWRRCSRCQLLTFTGGGARGICFDGGLHDVTDSQLHGVPIEFAPEGAQPGWRRCARCQGLVFSPGDFAEGVCVDGAAHDVTGSPAYEVAHRPAEPSSPPADDQPGLTLTENAEAITVVGTGFGAGRPVQLSFIQGARTVKVEVVVDADGAFRHVVAEVVGSEAGASVVSHEEGGVTATARLRSFVPAPLQPPG